MKMLDETIEDITHQIESKQKVLEHYHSDAYIQLVNRLDKEIEELMHVKIFLQDMQYKLNQGSQPGNYETSRELLNKIIDNIVNSEEK